MDFTKKSLSSLKIPSSVYRLQFNSDFTFKKAAACVPYLKSLGVEAIYASPCFEAVTGSAHGYNVANPNNLNPVLGTAKDYGHFCRTLKEAGMQQILDVVPNHMGIGGNNNPFWEDVLAKGPHSKYAGFFDIDWNPAKKELKNKVLLPVLGDHYGKVLEKGDLKLCVKNKRFFVRYHDFYFPVNNRSLSFIFNGRKKNFNDKTAMRNLLRRFNGKAGKPNSFDLLDNLLNRQYYRLAHWQVASEEINYRRFFDINELAALRMEDDRVFKTYHQLLFNLIKEGKVQGVRVDHPDGLYDPPAYFQKLRENAAKYVSSPFYIVVEKILDRKEDLPQNWKIHGTVGYDYLNTLNGLFVVQEAASSFDKIYAGFTGSALEYDELLYQKKKHFALLHMAGEINSLGYRLDKISETDRRYRDFTLNNLILAIRETIACFPVYRTYISPSAKKVSPRDRKFIYIAIEKAKQKTPSLDPAVYEFLKNILLLRHDMDASKKEKSLYRDFILRFQQLTSPIMAKGMEDTVFYIYNRLLSLNEVGGDPQHFGTSVEDFHQENRRRLDKWPYSFIATSTHDSKRGEDVRMRLNVLSEIPEKWEKMLRIFSQTNKKHKTLIGSSTFPDPNMEYFIYQTLLGIWPLGDLTEKERNIFHKRILNYLIKAAREAKTHTNWVVPNQIYETALIRFVKLILNDGKNNLFLRKFIPFQSKIAHYGILNSLSSIVLKIGSPGVLDTYQGAELWNLTLVDPDNRRPVEFTKRMRYLKQNKKKPASSVFNRLLANKKSGEIKQYLLSIGLNLRRSHRELFLRGDYFPVKVAGEKKNHVVAWQRKWKNQSIITAAGRFFTSLTPQTPGIKTNAWNNTYLVLKKNEKKESVFKNIFTDETVNPLYKGESVLLPLSKVFNQMSAAILTAEESDS